MKKTQLVVRKAVLPVAGLGTRMLPATKAIPKFKSDAAERKFWEDAANDATEYFDASTKQVSKFTNLKPTSKT
jgi:hypothetical protein